MIARTVLTASLALVALPLVAAPRPAGAPEPARAAAAPPGVRIWTSHGDTYRRGERVRVYFRTENDAYVTVLRVDTDGRVRILFPVRPDDPNLAHGGQTYTVDDLDGDDAFIVDDAPGVGYVYAVASADPFDYDAFSASDHWSLVQVANLADGRIHGDPYSSLDDLAHQIMPQGYEDYDTHLLPYYVEQRYQYPRFLCYDCHAYVPYAYWNPYSGFCSRFSLFVYYDPFYFYPSYWYPTRYYRGTNVVYVRPRFGGRGFVFRAAGDHERGQLVYRDRRGFGDGGGGEGGLQPGDRGVRGVDLGGTGSVPAPGGGGRRVAGGAVGGGVGAVAPGGVPVQRPGGAAEQAGGGRRYIGGPIQRTPATGPGDKVLNVNPGTGRRAADAPVRSSSDPKWIVGPDRAIPDAAPEQRPRGVYIDPGTRTQPGGGGGAATPQPQARPRGGFIEQGSGGRRDVAPPQQRSVSPPAAAGRSEPRYAQPPAPPSRGYSAPPSRGYSAPPSAPRGESRPAGRSGAPTLIRRRP